MLIIKRRCNFLIRGSRQSLWRNWLWQSLWTLRIIVWHSFRVHWEQDSQGKSVRHSLWHVSTSHLLSKRILLCFNIQAATLLIDTCHLYWRLNNRLAWSTCETSSKSKKTNSWHSMRCVTQVSASVVLYVARQTTALWSLQTNDTVVLTSARSCRNGSRSSWTKAI